tara:strand:- start:316 stop:561 length:246 start_codon:yes stop_codon:yes gene_type:complete
MVQKYLLDEMTILKFMNVVRFKLKPECLAKNFKVYMEFICEGLANKYIDQTGEDSYCLVGLWESKESLVSARLQMIAYLDK